MSVEPPRSRKPRVDVQRNREALLDAARRQFVRFGVGTREGDVSGDAPCSHAGEAAPAPAQRDQRQGARK